MALCTIDKTDESFAIQRLEKSGLEYEICPINAHRLNLFFGKKRMYRYCPVNLQPSIKPVNPRRRFYPGYHAGI